MWQTLGTVVSSCVLGVVYSIQCNTNDIGIDWTGSTSGGSSSAATWQSSFGSSDCGTTDEVCSATEYDIDVDVTVQNNLPAWLSWLFPQEWTWSASFGLDLSFCGDLDVCNAFAGGSDTCRAINFDFQQWFPTSCDNTTDYDATTMDFNITYKYGCCTTDDCNSNYDFSTCEYNNELGDYVSELYECWNGVRKDLMKYLVCDTSGNKIYNFEGTCRNAGQWLDTADNCTYILTCSPTFETILTNFGECACAAATDNGYPGVVISEIMQTQWNAYCPNVDLTCGTDGSLILDLNRVYVYWTFLLDISLDDIDASLRAKIVRAIAIAASVDSDLITIVSEEEGDTGRRRALARRALLSEGTTVTVQVETESESDATQIDSNLNDNGDDSVTTQTGYTSSGGSGTVSTEDTDDDEMGSSGYKVFISLTSLAILLTLSVIIV